MKPKKRILTGVTTSGSPHIGNLVGAVLPAIEASKSRETDSFLLADYHSLIKNHDPELTHNSSFEVAATWLSCGLDPKKLLSTGSPIAPNHGIGLGSWMSDSQGSA